MKGMLSSFRLPASPTIYISLVTPWNKDGWKGGGEKMAEE